MERRVQQARRWVDKFLPAGRRDKELKDLSRQQHRDLRITGNVYRKVASRYYSEERLGDNFEIISPFLMFVYKRGALIHTATEDDIFDYFSWIFKKGCPRNELLTAAACVVDLFQVLLQEGTVQRNPLFKVYKIFLEEDEIFSAFKVDPMLRKFDGKRPQKNQPTHPTDIYPTPASSHSVSLSSYPTPSYTVKTKTKSNGGLFVIVLILLTFGLTYIDIDDFYGTQGIKKNSGASLPLAGKKNDIGNSNNERIINLKRFFYEHSMSNYYCRDYLKTTCSPNNLIENPFSDEIENTHAGGEHYLKHCAKCHGDAGRGNGPDAVHFDTSPAKLGWAGDGILEKDAFLFWVVAEGSKDFGGSMPPYKDILKENEIWKVILFLKTLR